jgi:hypothetical protein
MACFNVDFIRFLKTHIHLDLLYSAVRGLQIIKGQPDFSPDDKSTISLGSEPYYLIRESFIAVKSSYNGGGGVGG